MDLHLISLLQKKHFVLCLVVDIMKPNAFGNQAIEVLEKLHGQVHTFPLVIIFTKWEKFKKQSNDKDFARREANGKNYKEVATEFLDALFDKFKAVGAKQLPRFAAVDALSSTEVLNFQQLRSTHDHAEIKASPENSESVCSSQSFALCVISCSPPSLLTYPDAFVLQSCI